MIENPLLDRPELEPACPTGWRDMAFPPGPYHGHSELAIRSSGVLRLFEVSGREPCVCARLWHPSGMIAGLYTEQGECVRMVGHAGRCNKVMGDAFAIGVLQRKIPWAKEAIRIPETHPLWALGLGYFPFSYLSHILVTMGSPADLLSAMVEASGIASLRRYGGCPVFCLPSLVDGGPDLGALSRIQWPNGVTVLATGADLADKVAEECFDVEVEEYPF
ncbi:MAG: hypothetical protein KJN79_00115 [Gammaproteobacteria bacterium]|nr:hypothetical protein [Gammaproteobacteria bacterium]